MTSIVTTALRQLTSLYKSVASTGSGSDTPFQQWDKRAFERWTQASRGQQLGKRLRTRESRASQARTSYSVFYQ